MRKNIPVKILIFLFFMIFNLFTVCADALSLFAEAEKRGMTLYWDTFTESGIIEKNGHTASFKINEKIVVFDSSLISIVEAPVLVENSINVSTEFMNAIENFFKNENEGSLFKIGAILIDPGHGGKDPGASQAFTINGKRVVITEKNITLSVGKKLYSMLKNSYPDKQIIMTRDTDVFLSLGERTDIANSVKLKENEAVLYVSIHVNASLDRKAYGYEVWYLSPGYRRTVIDRAKIENDEALFPILNSMMEEEFTTESILMAKFIMDGLKTQIGNQSQARGIKAEEWFVVRNANMPGVLIEVGFLTNEKEAANLNSESYLKKIGIGIYNGVVAFVTHFERSRGFTSKK